MVTDEEFDKITKEFEELTESLSDDEFWEYVRSWFDVQFIVRTMNDWDIETKKEAIEEMKAIKEKYNGK